MAALFCFLMFDRTTDSIMSNPSKLWQESFFELSISKRETSFDPDFSIKALMSSLEGLVPSPLPFFVLAK